MLARTLEWAEFTKVKVSDEPLVRDSVKNRIKSKRGNLDEFIALSADSGLAELLKSHPDLVEMAETEILYEGYVRQHKQQIARLLESDEKVIPTDFDFAKLISLSKESRDILGKVRPRTLGQASRLAGVTPSDSAILMVAVRQSVPRGTYP